jgi:hypothetical protein
LRLNQDRLFMDHSFLAAAVPIASRPRAIRLLLLVLSLVAFALWFSSRTLGSANFLPHWYCLAGNTRLLRTTVLGDLFIGLSYLAKCGYIVFDALSSQDALDLAKDHPGQIDVLITDVVMPGLRGPSCIARSPNFSPIFRLSLCPATRKAFRR